MEPIRMRKHERQRRLLPHARLVDKRVAIDRDEELLLRRQRLPILDIHLLARRLNLRLVDLHQRLLQVDLWRGPRARRSSCCLLLRWVPAAVESSRKGGGDDKGITAPGSSLSAKGRLGRRSELESRELARGGRCREEGSEGALEADGASFNLCRIHRVRFSLSRGA